MKRTSAILLLGIYLFGATDACQFLKLPLLVSHYVKHKSDNPQTTLAAFFKMHYIDPQPMDDDYAQDMRLPFKTMPKAFFRFTPIVISSIQALRTRWQVSYTEMPPLYNEVVTSVLLTNKIFQPPRI